MSVLFGYESALAIYRAMAFPDNYPRETVDLANMTSRASALTGTKWETWEPLAKPTQLVVATNNDVRRSRLARGHAWGTRHTQWPALNLGNDAYVSAPEWAFLQLAQSLDLAWLTFVGCELCGRHAWNKGELVHRNPLVTRASVGSFLAQEEGQPGIKKARRAIRHVLDGSSSPMETSLALTLSLPACCGGYGLPAPELNRCIELHGRARDILGFDAITPDLYWESAGLAGEYDSDAFHTNGAQIARDSRRRLALESQGIRVVSVTNEQFRRTADMDLIAREIGRTLGHRIRWSSVEDKASRYGLQQRLRSLAIGTPSCWA